MGTRWLNQREQRAWRAFLSLGRVLGLGIERQLAEAGLSGADYQLLVPLSEAPGRRLRPRDLGFSTGWDRSRLAHQLRRMEERGLVAREVCATDGRGTIVRLTKEGLAVVRRAAPGHVEWVRANFIDLLTEEELGVLIELSERVVSRLETPTGRGENGAPPTRSSRT